MIPSVGPFSNVRAERAWDAEWDVVVFWAALRGKGVRATDEWKKNPSSLQTKGKPKNYGTERLIAWFFFLQIRYGGGNGRFLVGALEAESESALPLVLLPACGSGRLGLQILAGPIAA